MKRNEAQHKYNGWRFFPKEILQIFVDAGSHHFLNKSIIWCVISEAT